MIDLDAIRERRGYDQFDGCHREDAAALLAYVDALREAAGKVTCAKCKGRGIVLIGDGYSVDQCPDCADLRALLERQPSPPEPLRSGPANARD